MCDGKQRPHFVVLVTLNLIKEKPSALSVKAALWSGTVSVVCHLSSLLLILFLLY